MLRDRSLPPLGPLRGFEAAARLGSFTRAAAELHLTQTAISHQVRTLEAQLGQQLFDRGGGQPTLTANGTRLQRLCTDYFDELNQLCADFKASDEHHPLLRIALAPAFASKWLTPKLPNFWARHTIQLDLLPSSTRLDYQKEQIDLGIRGGNGQWPGLISELLLPMRETPLCAPSLLHSAIPLKTPNDLQHHTLLHERDHEGWSDWLTSHDLPAINSRTGIICHDSIMLYDLIAAGQGVGLGSLSIIDAEFEKGTLVAPFADIVDPNDGYYLVYREGALRNPNAAAFRDFLISESFEHRRNVIDD